MSGPLPKPIERRQRRNVKAQLVAFPRTTALVLPDMPKGLLAATQKHWEAFWNSPLAEMVDHVTDGPAVSRLFTLYDERERAYKGYRSKRLVLGSTGQPSINPLGRFMKELDGEIRQMEDRLGLNPKARLQLGITAGHAARTLADLNSAIEVESDDHDGTEDPRILEA